METAKTVASIIGPIIGVISLLAAFYFYRRSRKYMELTYEVSPILALLRVGGAIRDKVKIEYEGEQIQNLTGVSVEVRNTGTEPVEYSHEADTHNTQTPLTLDFGEEARILGDPNVETSPKSLRVSAAKDPENTSRITVNKFLLNPGQSATISVFLTSYKGGKPDVYAQIKGVPPLRERPSDGPHWVSLRLLREMGFQIVLFIIAAALISGTLSAAADQLYRLLTGSGP